MVIILPWLLLLFLTCSFFLDQRPDISGWSFHCILC
jgi:hypothetical protein